MHSTNYVSTLIFRNKQSKRRHTKRVDFKISEVEIRESSIERNNKVGQQPTEIKEET